MIMMTMTMMMLGCMTPMTRPSRPCHCPAWGWRWPVRSGEQAGGGKGIPWLKVWTRWQLQFFAAKCFLKTELFQSHLRVWFPLPQIWDGNAIVPWWQKELHLKTFKPHCSFKSHDLGRFCVLQPDLIEQKEISILFQMHFKLQRFFCSGQDTKADWLTEKIR